MVERSELKGISWLGDTLNELRSWPKSVTEDMGQELLSVQRGRDPSDWKPLPSIGAGVKEIRVAQNGNQYRAIYIAKFPEAIYVLHAFEKKTQKMPTHDMEIAKKQYKALLSGRKKNE